MIPHMHPQDLEAFEALLTEQKVYLEYGAGGSTLLATSMGVDTFTVETSRTFHELVLQEWGEIVARSDKRRGRGKDRPGKLDVSWLNIGQVGEWGRPTGHDGRDRWAQYPIDPWVRCHAQMVDPGLVLIDGRFRVASFFATMLMGRSGTIVCFDDYVGRKSYHVVEAYLEPFKLGVRMAEFVVPDKPRRALACQQMLMHLGDPE
jgi:hypothetical protein